MKYLLMIYCDESPEAQKNETEQEKEMGAYFAFTKDAEVAGVKREGEALHPSSTATTVRVCNGKITSTDGPFAETKEQLGGYYVVECQNLDEAIQWASKIPHASETAVEVRPIVDFGPMPT